MSPRGNFPFQIMAWVAASFAGALAAGIAAQDPITELVADRTAVERVYYDHRLGAKPPFEEVLPAAEVARLVNADLHNEAVLVRVYHVEVSIPQVEVEVKRIDLETRAPEMLAEIKAALGNDPARFARAVAKPIVVDRELRRRFENDDRLHGAQRKQVEAARDKILALQRKENPWEAVLNAIKETTGGTVSDVRWQLGRRPEEAQSLNPRTPVEAPLLVKAQSSKYSLDATATFARPVSPAEPLNEQGQFKSGVGTARPQRVAAKTRMLGDGPSPPLSQSILESALSEQADKSWFGNLTPELRTILSAQLQKPHDVSAVIETPAGFLLFVTRERTEQVLSAAALSVSKISFEQWLSEQKE
jgi:hypothetical protein